MCWGEQLAIDTMTPLGYVAPPDVLADGCSGSSDVVLNCVAASGSPASMGFWKHEVVVATGGNGHGQIAGATLCTYLDLIAVHFNSNTINPVVVYHPPASGQCADKLLVARGLLDLNGNVPMIARARQQLMTLLLNVAAGDLAQSQVISADGATVSQAITYCDNT